MEFTHSILQNRINSGPFWRLQYPPDSWTWRNFSQFRTIPGVLVKTYLEEMRKPFFFRFQFRVIHGNVGFVKGDSP